MERHDEPKEADYPRGRGYGHDYMRGGEVFGGYGYQDRAGYQRPRGSQETDAAAVTPTADDRSAGEEEAGEEEEEEEEEFPQDERAGNWAVPHDLPEGAAEAARRAADRDGAGPDREAPVPQLEHTFGDIGGNRLHSRSYYVTQAQLQHRLFGK